MNKLGWTFDNYLCYIKYTRWYLWYFNSFELNYIFKKDLVKLNAAFKDMYHYIFPWLAQGRLVYLELKDIPKKVLEDELQLEDFDEIGKLLEYDYEKEEKNNNLELKSRSIFT